MNKQAYETSVGRVLSIGMSKQALGEAVPKLFEGFGNLSKAVTYLLVASTAAIGAGAGFLWSKATEPTDTDIGNAQKAYAVSNLKANINGQYVKLMDEIMDEQERQGRKNKTLRLS